MTRTIFVFLCAHFAVFGFLSYAEAHSSGASLIATSSPYVIDIGYEPLDMYVGGRMIFDIELEDLENTPRDFSRVWLRLEKERQTILATGVGKASLGPTTFMARIPKEWEGPLTLHVRFENDDDVLAESSFPLNIAPPLEKGGMLSHVQGMNPWILLLIGAVVGAGLVAAAYSRRV